MKKNIQTNKIIRISYRLIELFGGFREMTVVRLCTKNISWSSFLGSLEETKNIFLIYRPKPNSGLH